MNDSGEDLKRVARELGDELARTLEQAGRVMRDVLTDLSTRTPRRSATPVAGPASRDQSPIDTIRRLGELRDAGYLTDEEFQMTKTSLLENIR